MNKDVTMYTFSTCPFCIRAKEMLDRENIKYEEIEISNDREKLDVLEQKTGHSTVPQIFVGDKFIGGFDDLMDIHRNGKFNDIFR